MKRRDGSSRRQVLDIDNPSTSWKSKFQAMTERRLNGSFQSSSNSLSKLVGSYASESDEEDNAKSKNSLDAKVDEFMKEVESAKGNDDASIIPCAWQECYDEGTGYPYYWNMNTNEVTWEPPPELVAYQAAVAAKLAQTEAKVKAQVQQAQWAVEQAALGITPEHPPPQKKISGPAPSQRKHSKFSPSPASLHPGSHRNHGRIRKPSSGSEDEKIEMITSWVDEESEEEEETNDSHSQVSIDKKKSKDVSVKQSKPSSSRKPEKLPKQGPIGPPTTIMFGPQLPLPLSDTVSSKSKSRSRNGSTEEANEVESKVVIQKLRRLKTESDVIVGTRERVPIRKSLDRSRSGSPNDRLIVNSSKTKFLDCRSESESGSEKSVLSRLQKQVQKLRDLGGSVPSDIKGLLTSASKSSSLSSMTSADNIIAMIEMEQPPDHKQDDRLLLSLKTAEQRVIRAVEKIEAEGATNGSDKTRNEVQKPSSFALIAGYGDDSDPEEAVDSDTSANSKDKTVKEKTLFPILGHEDNSKSDISLKSAVKLTVESDSTATPKANLDVPSKPPLVLDHGPGQKRKKRLDIGTIIPPPPVSSSTCSALEASDDVSKPKGGPEASSGASTYTTVWSSTTTYSSDPTANDRRGFGFQVAPTYEESTIPPSKPKKGKVQFIKAETINLTQDDSKNVRDGENESDTIRKDTTSKSREDGDLHRSLSSLAQLVKAKLQFLSEGNEPVSPVQAMAIQIETLVSAWNAGALANSFLQRWLQSTGAELVQLERAAAPQGWAVQWDREYKRYFYCNLATKDTQWDYPVLPGDGSQETERKKEATKPAAAPRAATPPPDDEDAMELCTTPPPEEDIESATPPRPFSPPPNPPPSKKLKTDSSEPSQIDGEPLEPLGPPSQPPLPSAPQPPLPSSPPPPPPPPDSPPPPPPPGTPPSPTASSSSSSATTARVPELGEPLPPGVDNPADIPFIPVRPAMPPAPMVHPGPHPGPHGPHPGSHPGAHPMAADLSQVSHMALNPLQTVGALHPGSVLGVPVLSGVGVGVPHAAMAMPYSGNVAVSVASSYPASTEAMLAGYNAVDYMGYMGVYAAPAGPLQVASVVAPPLQYTGQAQAPPQPPTHVPQRKKEALMSELSSFYSDIASLDSNSRDATEDDTSQDAASVEQPRGKTSTPPVTAVPVATLSAEDTARPQHSFDISSPVVPTKSQSLSQESTMDSASAKKKKKPKLAPGLTLKKKGVSNMVAKWQQVQEEVWKDYRNEEAHE